MPNWLPLFILLMHSLVAVSMPLLPFAFTGPAFAMMVELLGAYFDGTGGPSAAEIGRVVLYKAMCDLLWTLWGLIQHKNGNPAEDFWKYATERFERCQALMASPEFESHVSAVRAG